MRRHITKIVPYTPFLTKCIYAMCAVIAFSIVLYGVFLLQAVAHTAERARLERDTKKLTSAVSVLEREYLLKTKELTAGRAHALGFVAPSQVSTVFAKRAVFSLHE